MLKMSMRILELCIATFIRHQIDDSLLTFRAATVDRIVKDSLGRSLASSVRQICIIPSVCVLLPQAACRRGYLNHAVWLQYRSMNDVNSEFQHAYSP
jgi:hypothetical protein